MRYSKQIVNEIISRVRAYLKNDPEHAEKNIQLLREEYQLVDRRKSALPAFASNVVHDLLVNCMPYKGLMQKYHCSHRTLMKLLNDCAESDDRVAIEMENRRKLLDSDQSA